MPQAERRPFPLPQRVLAQRRAEPWCGGAAAPLAAPGHGRSGGGRFLAGAGRRGKAGEIRGGDNRELLTRPVLPPLPAACRAPEVRDGECEGCARVGRAKGEVTGAVTGRGQEEPFGVIG